MRSLLIFISAVCLSLNVQAQLINDEALAAQYYQSGDYEKAATIYQKLFKKTSDKTYYEFYFSSLLRTKRYDDAEQMVKQQLKNNPTDNTYAIDLGKIYQERGENDKLAVWYNRVIKQLTKNELSIRNLAFAFYKAGFYEYAIKTFVVGRDLLGNNNAFSADLIDLYRFRKEKTMLTQEYLQALSLNPGLLDKVENTLSNIYENKQDYDYLKEVILKHLQKDPQNISFTELLIWQFVQQREFVTALKQTIALDKRLNESGDRIYDLSDVLIQNKAYDEAIEALNYLVAPGPNSKYYIQAKVNLLNIKTKLIVDGRNANADLLSLEKDYQTLLLELGKNVETVFAIRQLAYLQAYYLYKPTEAKILLEEVLNMPRLPPNTIGQVKLELGDVYIWADEIWDAALLYGQVSKQFANEPLGQEAKMRGAKLAYYRGDFAWAKMQLDVLKGSTSQLTANDALNMSLLISDNLQNEADTSALKKYAYADLLVFKNRLEKALVVLDSINVLYPKNSLADDILMSKAKIYITQSKYTEALSQLQKIATEYATDIWGDAAVFMQADIYENKLNQPDKAKEFYQKIITDFPGSLYITDARKRFRTLRGDKD